MLGLCGVQSEREAPAELMVGLNEHGLLYAKPSRGTSQEVRVRQAKVYTVLDLKYSSLRPSESLLSNEDCKKND